MFCLFFILFSSPIFFAWKKYSVRLTVGGGGGGGKYVPVKMFCKTIYYSRVEQTGCKAYGFDMTKSNSPEYSEIAVHVLLYSN